MHAPVPGALNVDNPCAPAQAIAEAKGIPVLGLDVWEHVRLLPSLKMCSLHSIWVVPLLNLSLLLVLCRPTT